MTTIDFDIPQDVLEAGMACIERYCRMVMDGTSPRLAEVLALRRPPRANTDREFFEGHCNGNQFSGNEEQGEYLRRQALQHGYNPGRNDVYISQLAAFPGDPKAFVPASGGRSHIASVLRERGWGSSGSVNVAAQETEFDPTPKTPLAEDLVQRHMKRRMKDNPDMTAKQKRELREQVIQDHGFRK